MKVKFPTTVLLLAITSATLSAQVASHAPTNQGSQLPPAQMATAVVNDNPVVRVNGVALTNRDLVREMYAIFPYGQQHNGFPKGLEPQIRKGALDMIIFEELVFQETQRRHLTVGPERVTQSLAQFKKQFPNKDIYKGYLNVECKGSEQVLRGRIRRSLLIEDFMKSQVGDQSIVTVAQARKYYDTHPNEYKYGETVSIQTISIMPPANAGAEIQKEARRRAEDALKQAKATKSYREFGLLAEKVSDDDWHVNMGDRKKTDVAQLPPPIVDAARKMKAGDVSDLFTFGPNYTLFRLNEHKMPGRAKFEDIRKQLMTDLQKEKYNQARSSLGERLRKSAKIEML